MSFTPAQESSRPNEIIRIVLPISVPAFVAMTEGLGRRWPGSVVIDPLGGAKEATIELRGEHVEYPDEEQDPVVLLHLIEQLHEAMVSGKPYDEQLRARVFEVLGRDE